ncbi:response regulator transcription factor [Flavobacterium sp. xlx-214]|uniref:LytR/AlgR family response regulator transcription factor n=1 Tax=unclassified Flavobacterium TaxID=196869 RepID=UPI0013D67C03|nr:MULTISPECIES: LytTR family DNA-binding domain-containing protein [unclassified Flavobacterium]MBA5793693.1 response regulator transcription factor [Flavobacterium sp. xlx-221]QMI83283.1 response regulator transcription factor [Flavobacterium sp. xlx-214]
MKVVIIEDEKPAARLLKRKLELYQCDVVAVLTSVTESIEWFLSNPHPDLLFVDIQLSDGLSFEIFEQVTINSSIIFTTAYDEYALKAFKLNSIDYLLKPIDENELKAALDKFRSIHNKVVLNHQILNTIYEKEFKKRFVVKVGNIIKIVDINDVECFLSSFKSSYLITNEGKSYPLDESLETIENELDTSVFFRTNRQFIIAMQAIKEISIYSNSRLKISLNNYKEEEIIVSRERVQSFKQWINE